MKKINLLFLAVLLTLTAIGSSKAIASVDTTAPSLTIGPSPAHDYVQAFTIGIDVAGATIQIYDMWAKQVYYQPFFGTGSVNLHNIKPRLQAGDYIFVLTLRDGTKYSFKFMVR